MMEDWNDGMVEGWDDKITNERNGYSILLS